MLKCPKCGSYSIVGPAYDRQADMLIYRCVCGYSEERMPQDRRRQRRDQEDIAEMFRRLRESGAIKPKGYDLCPPHCPCHRVRVLDR